MVYSTWINRLGIEFIQLFPKRSRECYMFLASTQREASQNDLSLRRKHHNPVVGRTPRIQCRSTSRLHIFRVQLNIVDVPHRTATTTKSVIARSLDEAKQRDLLSGAAAKTPRRGPRRAGAWAAQRIIRDVGREVRP